MDNQSNEPEKFLTIPSAAKALNIPAYKLRAAVNLGLVPAHFLYNKIRLVLLSEVRASFQRTPSQ